jgi:hypothetical protein
MSQIKGKNTKSSRTGTRIRITELRNVWDRRMIIELYKSIFSLQSPFKRGGDFDVDLKLSNEDLIVDLPTLDSIKQFSLFHFKCIDNQLLQEKIHGSKKEYRIINLEKNYSSGTDERLRSNFLPFFWSSLFNGNAFRAADKSARVLVR